MELGKSLVNHPRHRPEESDIPRGKTLSPIMGRPVNEGVVLDHWGSDVMMLTASIKTGSAKPSHLLRKLGAFRQLNCPIF